MKGVIRGLKLSPAFKHLSDKDKRKKGGGMALHLQLKKARKRGKRLGALHVK